MTSELKLEKMNCNSVNFDVKIFDFVDAQDDLRLCLSNTPKQVHGVGKMLSKIFIFLDLAKDFTDAFKMSMIKFLLIKFKKENDVHLRHTS